MTEATKNQLRDMTGNINIALAREAEQLQDIIDHPGDLNEQISPQIAVCGDLKSAVDAVYAIIEQEPITDNKNDVLVKQYQGRAGTNESGLQINFEIKVFPKA